MRLPPISTPTGPISFPGMVTASSFQKLSTNMLTCLPISGHPPLLFHFSLTVPSTKHVTWDFSRTCLYWLQKAPQHEISRSHHPKWPSCLPQWALPHAPEQSCHTHQ